MAELIPAEVTRFILTCIRSVPHLEALLLLRGDQSELWVSTHVAKRLYVSEQVAETLLIDLRNAGFLSFDAGTQCFGYAPVTGELQRMIDELAGIYARNIVVVSNLIHSSRDNKVQQFADAFKWRKDS